jgi:hypothetical protein
MSLPLVPQTLQLARTLTGRAHAALVQLHAAVLTAGAHPNDQHSQILAAAGDIPTITNTAPPGSASLLKIIGWCSWAAFAACLLGVFIIVIKMAVHAHSDRGEAGQQSGRLFWPLLGAIVAGSAGAILGAV